MKLRLRIKALIANNKTAIIVGILIGAVWTRFLDEDGNLPVTIVFTGMTTMASLVTWIVFKRMIDGSSKESAQRLDSIYPQDNAGPLA